MQGFCLISFFSAFLLASTIAVSAHDLESEAMHLHNEEILRTRRPLLKRTSGKDQSQKDTSPQRINRVTIPVPILYERPRPPPRSQRVVPQTSRSDLSSDSRRGTSNLVDPHRIPGRIRPADGQITGYSPGLSQAQTQVSRAILGQPSSGYHDLRRPQRSLETSRQSDRRKDLNPDSTVHSLGQDISRLQLERTSPIKAVVRPRPTSVKTKTPDTSQGSSISLQSAEPSRAPKTNLKTQHTPSKVNNNPFAKLAELDSSLDETSSSSSHSNSPKASVTNKSEGKVLSQSAPLSLPERNVPSASTSLQSSSGNQNSVSGRSGQGLQDQSGSSERSTSKKKSRSKGKQKDEAKPEIVQPQSRQQIGRGPQSSTPSSSRSETGTWSSLRSLKMVKSMTKIVENPIPEVMLNQWRGKPARGFVEPSRPPDAIDRMKEYPGIWAHTSVYGKGPAQGNAATASEWTPLIESESGVPLKASAHHPQLAFAQAKSKTIRDRRGEAIEKGEINGKASGDHVWGYFRPGTTSPINLDWNKGDGRTGTTTLPARPADSDWMLVKESLNTDNPTARGPSFTARTQGSGKFVLFAKMGSPPTTDELSPIQT